MKQDGDFQLSARDLTAVWGANPKQRHTRRVRTRLLQSLGFSSLCISSAASFFPPLPSHAKAPVCVKQTHLYFPLRPGGQSSDTQSVPKVRQLNWGAASQFRPVYTLYPKNAICTKAGSHNSYFFLILPNQKLYCTQDYRKASCKGSHLMRTLLPPSQEKMLHTETGKTLFFLLLTFPVTRKTH